MKKRNGSRLLFVLFTLSLSPYTSAVDYSVRGFGTLGVVHTNNDQIDYVTSIRNQANGAGYTRSWDLIQDSKLGVHVDAFFNDKWSANLQVVENRTIENDFVPEIRWASLKYQATPDLSFRAGRVAVPSYMLSDSVSLGYTYPWVRLPTEIYSKIPSKWQESVDAKYHMAFGSLHLNLGLYLAIPFERETATGTVTESDGAQTFIVTADYKDWQFGVRHGQSKIKVNTARGNTLFAGYRNAANALQTNFADKAQQARDLSKLYSEDFQDASYTSVGAMFDNGSFLFLSEFLTVRAEKQLAGSTESWFATLGYYYNEFTPFISIGSNKSTSEKSLAGVDPSGLTGPLAGQVGGLNTGLNAAVDMIRNQGQKSVSIGTRWDFMPNLAAKVQFDRFFLDDNSNGLFINAQPEFERGTNINMISASLDFIF